MNGVGGNHSSFSPSGCTQNAHKLSSQENHVLGRWYPTLLLTSPDLCIQGPRGLTLNSLPRLGTGERTLGRESEVGVPSFYLLAVNCVGLGQDSDRCAHLSFFTCMYTYLT